MKGLICALFTLAIIIALYLLSDKKKDDDNDDLTIDRLVN